MLVSITSRKFRIPIRSTIINILCDFKLSQYEYITDSLLESFCFLMRISNLTVLWSITNQSRHACNIQITLRIGLTGNRGQKSFFIRIPQYQIKLS